MSDYAVVGDPEMSGFIRKALSKHGMSVLSDDELEIQDEWNARRWFSRNQVDGVFISVGLLGQTSVQNFAFTTGGTYNVIRAAVGNTKRLLLVSSFPTGEFFLMSRLVDLYFHEKQCDFHSVVRNTTEQAGAFAERCVLLMRDVSAKEANEGRTQSADQRREVRDPVVPQSQGNQQHGSPVKPVLEVSVQASAGTPSGDLRAERPAAEGEKTPGANDPNSGPI